MMEDDNSGDDEEEYPALEQLLQELRTIAVAGDFSVQEAVCRAKARNVLEATAGDVRTAAQLYWDDFLATRQQLQQQQLAVAERLAAAAAARAPDVRAPELEDLDGEDSNHSDDEEEDEVPNEPPLHERAIADHSDDEPPPEINGDPNIAAELRRRLFPGTLARTSGPGWTA